MPKPRQRESSEQAIDSSPPTSGLTHTHRLQRQQRIARSSHFQETFAQQQKWVGKYLILWLRNTPDAQLRLGVISSKKVHPRANKRNLARRRIREAYRHLRPQLHGNTDLVFVARRALLTAPHHALQTEMRTLTQQAGLLTTTTQPPKQHD